MERKAIRREPLQNIFPIIIVLAYLTITVLLFAFGPYNYPVENKGLLYLFLVSVEVMILFGYYVGIKKKDNTFPKNLERGIKFFKKSMLIFLIFIPFTNFLNTGSFIFNFNAINNLGGAYTESLALRQGRGFSIIISYLRIFFSPFLIAFIPLGLFYWENLKKRTKILYLIGVLGGLGLDLFRGTNKTLADYLIIFLVLFLYKSVKSARVRKKSLLNPYLYKNVNISFFNKLLKLLVVISIMFLLFFVYFSNSAPNRYGIRIYGPTGQYFLDVNHISLSWIKSGELKLIVGAFIHYFTQGYYALGLAISKPFLPTFGFGSSMAILINVSRLFNTNYLFERTYVYRNYLYDGWDWHMQWSTFYTWVASDISFIGVLILMFIIGYLLARTWKRAKDKNDYISLVVFVQLMLLCFYLPANNQLFQSYEGLFGNMSWLMIWLLSIKKMKEKSA